MGLLAPCGDEHVTPREEGDAGGGLPVALHLPSPRGHLHLEPPRLTCPAGRVASLMVPLGPPPATRASDPAVACSSPSPHRPRVSKVRVQFCVAQAALWQGVGLPRLDLYLDTLDHGTLEPELASQYNTWRWCRWSDPLLTSMSVPWLRTS